MTEIKKNKFCISCRARLPNDIVLIGKQYPSAIFLSEKIKKPKNLKSSSLNLTRCINVDCNLIQLSHIYNLQYIFDNYPYESGATANMKKILKDVIIDAYKIHPLKKKRCRS